MVKHEITDFELIKLFKTKVYTCDIETGIVYSGKLKRRTWKDNEGYEFIKIKYDKRQRTISVAKLVWMISRDKVVPKGFEIHHDDKDKSNNNYRNLICLYHLDHYFLHGRKLYEDEVEVPF